MDDFFIVTENGDEWVTETGDFIAWRDEVLPPWFGVGLALIITETGDPWITEDGDFIVWQGINESITHRYVRLVPSTASTPQLIDLPAVAPNQIQTMAVDFGRYLPPTVTLQGIPTLSMSVRLGDDATPLDRLFVGPIIGTVPTSLGGTGLPKTAIIFQLRDCLGDVSYVIDMYCDRSDGDVAESSVRFACLFPS